MEEEKPRANDMRSMSDVGSVPFRQNKLPDSLMLGTPAPLSTVAKLKTVTNGHLDELEVRRKQLIKELAALTTEISQLHTVKLLTAAFNDTSE